MTDIATINDDGEEVVSCTPSTFIDWRKKELKKLKKTKKYNYKNDLFLGLNIIKPNLSTDQKLALNIDTDGDANENLYAMMLYVPKMSEAEHYHIKWTDDELRLMHEWIEEYFKVKEQHKIHENQN